MEFNSLLSDAISYWERKRIIYNLVLALLVIGFWGVDIISSGPQQWLGAAMVLLMFALIANALYCCAYPVELVMRATPYRDSWKRYRWVVFAGGMGVASVLAIWIMVRPGMG